MPVFEEISAEQTGGVPVKIWTEGIEPAARQQLVALAGSPYVVGHVAAMPDVHPSAGVTVGSVFATREAVLPTAVGADVGCGVLAQPLDLRADDLPPAILRELHAVLKLAIPAGPAHHAAPQDWDGFAPAAGYGAAVAPVVREDGPFHLGTLGGGNHFVELGADETGAVWCLVHSGSRGVGARIAAHHAAVARAVNAGLPRPSSAELPAVSVDSPAGAACLADLAWATEFARENRRRILLTVVHALARVIRKRRRIDAEPDLDRLVDTAHNFVAAEETAGGRLWVHRKGAAPAPAGALGVIPGSMATGAYVVRGLGNPASFASCAHGAGRIMSRGQARRSLTVESFKVRMRGIVAETGERFLDEAPGAYRPLDAVMERQLDLVAPVHRLTPLLNLKGSDRSVHPAAEPAARTRPAHYDRSRDRDSVLEQRKREQRERRRR